MTFFITETLSSRALLLLLLTYLVSWENVASASTCVKRDENTQKSLKRLFTLASIVSDVINSQATQIFTEFDKQYAQGKGYNYRMPDSCPTDGFVAPANKEQVLEINPEVLLNLINNLLHSWTKTLNHIVKKISVNQGDPYAFLSNAREMQRKFKQLMEGIQTILSEVGEKYQETYHEWSGLASLQSSNEDARCFAFYNMIRCMNKDSFRVKTYLSVLRYRMIHQNSC